MKKLILFLFALTLSVAALFAQAPQKMSYQAVVRNTNNTLVTNQSVTARISIIQGGVYGTPVYVETHNVTTNANGLLTLEVGEGSVLNGSMSAIDWANGPFYLKSEIDPAGGSTYIIEGVQQLLSVPYALYAGAAGNVPAIGVSEVDSGYVLTVTQPGGQPQTFFLPTGGQGAQGPAGPEGPQGPAGLSAYQLWLNAGNTGTEADFLASLVGANGSDGNDGNDGNDGAPGRGIDSVAKTGTAGNVDTYTLYYSDNTTSTFTVTNGVDGTDGADGQDGQDGNDGADGFSPTITVSQGAAGTVLTITDANGTHQYTIPNGGGSGSGGTLVQQQVDWNETDPTAVTYILNKPALATVATTGSYNDLLNRPALATVATTGSYNDLSGKPTIPAPASDGQLTIKRNGVPVGTFTANQATNSAIDITVPTQTSELANNSGYITSAAVPTLSVTQTETGYVLTVTQPGGQPQQYVLTNGADGADGQDGVSPTVTAAAGSGSVIITVTDATGQHSYTIPTVDGTASQLPANWNETDPSSPQFILNKPTIPTVNDATLTIQKNGAEVGTFTANQGTDQTINIEVPTKTSDLTNDSGYLTAETDPQFNAWDKNYNDLTNKPTLAPVATSGNYSDLSNTPDLSGYLTAETDPTVNDATLTIQKNGVSVETFTANDNTDKTANIEVPTKTSDLTNDAGYLTADSLADLTDQTNAMQHALDSLQQAVGDVIICGVSKVKDYDGNEYNTVRIGNQCWMKENLRTTKYADGTAIALGTSNSTETAYRYNPNNDASNVDTYGYLYNWKAVMGSSSSSDANPSGVQGICPTGWHVPSDAEWTQLTGYVSSQSQYVCGSNSSYIAKALAATTGWNASNNICAVGNDLSANNATGFSALPAGSYYYGESSGYSNFNQKGYFWSTTASGSLYPYMRTLSNTSAEVGIYAVIRDAGFSVRCLRNASAFAMEEALNDLQHEMQQQLDSVQEQLDSVQTEINGQIEDILQQLGGNPIMNCPDSVQDYDGNTYHTVGIGNQCWMRENMRATHYADGTAVAGYNHANNDSGNDATYGLLYNWTVAMNDNARAFPGDLQGICPSGWRVPTQTDYLQLATYVSGQNSYVCDTAYREDLRVNRIVFFGIAKALSSPTGWTANSTNDCAPGYQPGLNNATGFTAQAAGWRNSSTGSVAEFGEHAYFWTSTPYESDNAFFFSIGNYTTYRFVSIGSSVKGNGNPVRCIRDNSLSEAVNEMNEAINSLENAGFLTAETDPTVNDATLTIQQNGTEVGTFTANQDADQTVNITTPTLAEIQALIDNSITPLQNQVNDLQDQNAALQNSLDNVNFICGNTIKDYDGNEYNTVRIGDQCWTKENLRTTHYSDGVAINYLGNADFDTDPWYGYPDNNVNYVPTMGYLYNSIAALRGAAGTIANPSGVQGICPSGWHVPSSTEWKQLTDYVSSKSNFICGGNVNNIAKALCDNSLWFSSTNECCPGNDLTTNNATGFSALPTGYIDQSSQTAIAYRLLAYFWLTQDNFDMYGTGFISRDDSRVRSLVLNASQNKSGYSVRCLRDATSLGDQINQVNEQLQNVNDQNTALQEELDNVNFVCGTSTVTDYDGNEYNTVRIGGQCWTKENLRTTKYADGTAIALGTSTSSTTAYRYNPNNDASNVATYGYLYNWKAVMGSSSSSEANPSGVQGICPTGWHVPSHAEWTQLTGYVSSQSQYVCGGNSSYIAKALAATTGWNTSSNTCAVGNDLTANNATGFSALPAGDYWGSYSNVGSDATFWSATENENDVTRAYDLSIHNMSHLVIRSAPEKFRGFSVRCLRDATSLGDQINQVNDQNTALQEELENLTRTYECEHDGVVDVDGNVYGAVMIGTQCWMKENLRTTKYADGTTIGPGSSSSSTTTAYRYYPNNNFSNVDTYGYLYNWKAVMGSSSSSNANPSGVQGICPTGWHVPSDAEWAQLTDYVSSQSQYVCGSESDDIAKALAATTGWNTSSTTCAVGNNLTANNRTGFSALPAGFYYNSNYYQLNQFVCFWSTYETIGSFDDVFTRSLTYDSPMVSSSTTFGKDAAVSVRCLRDY